METMTETKKEERKKKRAGILKNAAAMLAVLSLALGAVYMGLGEGKAQAGLPALGESALEDAVSDALPVSYTFTSASTGTSLESYSDVYKIVMNAVVSINTTSFVTSPSTDIYVFGVPWGGTQNGRSQSQREVRGAASGVIFYEDSKNVYIVTNFHVVDGASACTISLDDETQIEATYVGGDASADIAVISVKKSELRAAGVTDYTVAVFGNSDAMEIADQVMAVGNALGQGKSATLGIISVINKNVTVDNLSLSLFQTDAAINSGNSGGALVNMKGEVIGINALKMSSSSVEGIGFAIPSNTFIDILDDIMDNGTVVRPYLGIEGQTLSDGIKEEYNITTDGVLVVNVLSGYTAEALGMRANDIITAYNGEEITTMEELKAMIEATDIGDEIEIEIIRGTYRNTGFGTVITGFDTMTLTGVMQNFTVDPEF